MSTQSVSKMMMVGLVHCQIDITNLLQCFTEPFAVAFVETTHTVDESVGAVEICVNLTQPMIDILEETVNVYVIDDSSSVYIPPGAPLASESSHKCSNTLYLLSLPPQLLMNQTFSAYTPWQIGLTLPSRHFLAISFII